jgi:hypothetical protein
MSKLLLTVSKRQSKPLATIPNDIGDITDPDASNCPFVAYPPFPLTFYPSHPTFVFIHRHRVTRLSRSSAALFSSFASDIVLRLVRLLCRHHCRFESLHHSILMAWIADVSVAVDVAAAVAVGNGARAVTR